MKSIERHNLKEDEFITTLHDTFTRIEEHRRQVMWAIVALVVIAVAAGGVIWWRQDVNAKAAALLADAQVVGRGAGGTASAACDDGDHPTGAGSNTRQLSHGARKTRSGAAEIPRGGRRVSVERSGTRSPLFSRQYLWSLLGGPQTRRPDIRK